MQRPTIATRNGDTLSAMRRREFLIAAAGALALTGCTGQPPPTPATTVTRTGTAGTAVPPAQAPPPTPQPTPGTPGTPAQMLPRSTVPMLCYHQIRDPTPADGPTARSLTCPSALLERHLRALSATGIHPVASSQLIEHVEFGTPLPPRPVAISFDDASEGHFSHALPILQRLSMPATFFIMTVVLDKPNWLSREQVRLLEKPG